MDRNKYYAIAEAYRKYSTRQQMVNKVLAEFPGEDEFLLEELVDAIDAYYDLSFDADGNFIK